MNLNIVFRAAASVCLVAQVGFAAGRPSPDPAPSSLAARLANPPAEARLLKIIHGWPDKPEAQDEVIRRLTGQGFGGVVCNVSFDQYLESESRWQAFTRAVRAAKEAGLALWLYDERGYPSGNAGGLVLREHPEWEARGWLVASQEFGAGPVELAVPPGQPVLTAAFPVRDGRLEVAGQVDLSAQVRDGQVRWQAPAGRWHMLAVTESRLYEGTHADGNLWQKMPYINLLQPEPTKRFLELTHAAYARRLGTDLGRDFIATFTDEPSLMSCFLKPMPYRPLPWASNLPVEFQRRRGYALEASVIPSLVADAGPGTSKHRYDYWLTVGELVAENFFGQIQDWCRPHRILSGGHLLMEEGLVAHVPLYGDFFRCARRLDAPSIDCLTSVPAEVPWHIARLLASAAELEGNSVVMSETSDHAQRYRPAGDSRPKRSVTEAEIRGTCNRQMVSGVNRITSYYSFADLGDDALRRLNAWVGRCGTVLAGGHQVADIAVLYPVESLWIRFTPARHWANESPGASRIESLYRAAAESLFQAQRDFTFIDSRTLATARTGRGELVHGSLRWRVVVLPGVDTLPLAAWENLASFVRDGGVAIALGDLPRNSERDFPSDRVKALAREVFGTAQNEPQVSLNRSGGAGIFLPHGSEGLLSLVLAGVLDPDVKVAGGRAPLRATHRRIDGCEIYFLINDSPKPWSGEVSFAAADGEHWDPATGQRAGTVRGSSTALSLGPYGGALFRFATARPPARRAITAGPLPNLSVQAVPSVVPTVPHGEFVRVELKPDAAHSGKDATAWEATGVLTKGGVDTFLFAQFHHAEPLDLGEADCLVIETWVPDGQKTPNQLLVIIHEGGGGDFIAHTGRSLGAPGHERSFVALSRFQPAGWSQDNDGVLDARRVGDIRIGWGGYLGAEGERVQFSVAVPQVGRIRRGGTRAADSK